MRSFFTRKLFWQIAVYDVLFIAVLAMVVIVKWQDLSLPYFWDELGVYTLGANHMYHHGISLQPSSLDPVISRGHPLLFFALYAYVFKIFGNAVEVTHTLSLVISLVHLAVVYRFSKKYFGGFVAVSASLLFASIPVFLALSSLMLPEMLLSLFVFLSLFAWYEKRFVAAGIYAALAILTKESAIVLPCAFAAHIVLLWIFDREKRTPISFRQITGILLPVIAFGVFLIVQKIQNGWFFFPYHIDKVGESGKYFITNFKLYFHYMFRLQGRYWWRWVILIALVLAFVFQKLSFKKIIQSPFSLFIIYITGFWIFSSLNFTGLRYILNLFPYICIGIALSAEFAFRKKIFSIAVVGILIFLSSQYWEQPQFDYDSDLSYRAHIRALKAATDFTEREKLQPLFGNFPFYFAVTDTEAGYVKHFLPEMNEHPDSGYYVICEPGDERRPDRNVYQMDWYNQFTDSYAKVVVYKIKKK